MPLDKALLLQRLERLRDGARRRPHPLGNLPGADGFALRSERVDGHERACFARGDAVWRRLRKEALSVKTLEELGELSLGLLHGGCHDGPLPFAL